MKALSFPKSSRLLTPKDYAKVFDDVQIRVPHRNFLILATSNARGHARIGLVFSKKNLKLAVQRNRINDEFAKPSDTGLIFPLWILLSWDGEVWLISTIRY